MEIVANISQLGLFTLINTDVSPSIKLTLVSVQVTFLSEVIKNENKKKTWYKLIVNQYWLITE